MQAGRKRKRKRGALEVLRENHGHKAETMDCFAKNCYAKVTMDENRLDKNMFQYITEL